MKVIPIPQAKSHLENLLNSDLAIMLWGPPGIGKSSIVKQICKERKWGLIDLRLSMVNPVDLRGLPFIDRDEKRAVWMQPEFLPVEAKDGKHGVLFLDEINLAPNSVMAAVYQLVLDRQVGNYKLPDGWHIMAAGNRETDKTNVNKMPSALANRLIHLEVSADFKGWKQWAFENDIDQRVISFLDFKPDTFSPPIEKEAKDLRAYPTPRSWEFVSDILKLYPDPDDARPAVEGAVGEGAAVEFFGFLPRFKAIPDAMEILEGKSKEVPKQPDVMDALINALVGNLEDKYLENFLDYTFLLKGEYAILAMKQAIAKGFEEKIVALPRWEEWSDNYYDLL